MSDLHLGPHLTQKTRQSSIGYRHAHIVWSQAVPILLMALIYYVSGKLSLIVFEQDRIVTLVIFAAEGFALAGALIYGRRMWIGVFIGQFFLAIDSGLTLPPSLTVAAINSLEVLLAVTLFTYLHINRRLSRLRDIIRLFLLIILILQPFSAIFGNLALLLFNEIQPEDLRQNLLFWWFGNILGQIIFTPMLLVIHFNSREINWVYFIIIGLLFFCLCFFLMVILKIESLSLLISITMPLVLYATTKSRSCASSAVVAITAASIYSSHLNTGPFSHSSMTDNIIDLNFYILSHALLVYIFGTLFHEKQEAIHKLQSMANFDFLTGLPNRHLLREEIHHTVYMAHERGQKSAICFLDLDGFKQVNDSLGHSAGDEVLKEVVERVREHTKDRDTFLRLGGDEFLLIIDNIPSKETVSEKLNELLSKVAKPIIIGDHKIEISLSIGIAICPEHGTSVHSLMQASDAAMYEAKMRGKNCFVHAP